MHVQFADSVTLAGYSFSSRTPVPGEEMTVTLYWTATGRVAESYTVFAHLLTDSFEMFGGADLMPSPPTEVWAVGDTVATVHNSPSRRTPAPAFIRSRSGCTPGPIFDDCACWTG